MRKIVTPCIHWGGTRELGSWELERRRRRELGVGGRRAAQLHRELGVGAASYSRARGRHGGSGRTGGAAPKSGFHIPIRMQPPSRWMQTILRADLSSSREVDSSNNIRIILGEIYKKLDLPPIDHHTPRVVCTCKCVYTCIDTQFLKA